MSIEKRIVEAQYMTSALRREASEEITRLRNALEQSIKMCAEHRDGRLAAREFVAVLEHRLQEIGDLAASCRTGPALMEALAQLESEAEADYKKLCEERRDDIAISHYESQREAA